jgi:hypothetical protein
MIFLPLITKPDPEDFLTFSNFHGALHDGTKLEFMILTTDFSGSDSDTRTVGQRILNVKKNIISFCTGYTLLKFFLQVKLESYPKAHTLFTGFNS